MKFLPAGENWKWKQINIGIQRIFVKENELVVSEQKPNISLIEIDKTKAESFLKDLRKLKGLGEIDDPEEVLGRLEALALINNKEAINILNNFESYFNYQTDGVLAEQWKNAVATVEWINN